VRNPYIINFLIQVIVNQTNFPSYLRYGHQDQIMSIDTLSLERCVSAGARDRTCRLFKVIEEKQLIFRGDVTIIKRDNVTFKEDSIDVVEMIDENRFLSGGNSGYDK
jgi:ribosomal RNA-processing protein 9